MNKPKVSLMFIGAYMEEYDRVKFIEEYIKKGVRSNGKKNSRPR